MKILFYTDVHFRESSSYPLFNRVQENQLTGELNNILLGFDFLKEQIIINEPDLVVNLGDNYHKDNYISVRTLYSASKGFKKVSSICKRMEIDHLILSGNHDTYSVFDDGSKLTSISSLQAYGTIITDKLSYDMPKGFRLFLWAYNDNMDESYQAILEGSSHDLIATHLDFLGAVNDNNHSVEHGMDCHVSVPVICGHIHLPQETGSVTFPGSLVQNRFTRESLDDVGGALIYDTDTGKKKLIQNSKSKHFVKVKNLDRLNDLDPERCILKVYSEVPEEEVKQILNGYEYMYVHSKIKEETSSSYIRHEIEKPETLLRTYIAGERPDLINIYDRVIK